MERADSSPHQAWAPIFFPAMGGGASVIRAVRALRPLRALKRMPGMPKLVGSLLSSIPKLADVLVCTSAPPPRHLRTTLVPIWAAKRLMEKHRF